MGELNKKKRKHDHSLTDLLKVGIFSLVMLAPFISIGVRCGYVMWNKNAKDSYSGSINNSYTYEKNSDINANNEYMIYKPSGVSATWSMSSIIKVDNFTLNTSNANLQSWYENNTTPIDSFIYTYQSGYQQYAILLFDVNGTQLNSISNSFINNTTTLTINFLALTSTTSNNNNFIYEKTYSQNSFIDNAFSYSVSQISNDPVFNWTRNTGIYTPINSMVEGLEIENDTLQILLAYWSLMTAVYIVFDLIIFCFTKLTHFVND